MSSLVVLNEQDMEWFLDADDNFPRISYHNNNVWATYNDLVRALGQPTFGVASEDGKVNVEWMGVMSRDNGLVIPNSAWTLYDWKEAESPKDHPDEEYGWHIGSQGGMLETEIQDLIMRELRRVGASRTRHNGFRVRAGVWSDPFHDMKKAKQLVRIYNKANDREAYESEDDLLDSLYYVFGDDILFDRIREAGQEEAPRLIRERVAEFLNDPNLVATYPQEVVNYLKRGLDIDEEQTNDIIDEALRGVYGDDFVNDLYERTASRRRYKDKRVSANNETAWEWNPRRNIIVAERARFWNDILNGEKKMTFFFAPDVQFPCIVYMNDDNTNKLIGKAICDGVTERMYDDGVTRVKLYDWSFSNPYDYGDRAYTIDNPPEKWRYMTQEEKDRIW